MIEYLTFFVEISIGLPRLSFHSSWDKTISGFSCSISVFLTISLSIVLYLSPAYSFFELAVSKTPLFCEIWILSDIFEYYFQRYQHLAFAVSTAIQIKSHILGRLLLSLPWLKTLFFLQKIQQKPATRI